MQCASSDDVDTCSLYVCAVGQKEFLEFAQRSQNARLAKGDK